MESYRVFSYSHKDRDLAEKVVASGKICQRWASASRPRSGPGKMWCRKRFDTIHLPNITIFYKSDCRTWVLMRWPRLPHNLGLKGKGVCRTRRRSPVDGL